MMATVFLNWKGPQGRETVDELSDSDFATWKEFRGEVRRLCGEYSLAGMSVYPSSRCCANWKEESEK